MHAHEFIVATNQKLDYATRVRAVINAYETGLVAPGSPHGYRQQTTEPLWSPLGATGGNQRQIARANERKKQAKTVAVVATGHEEYMVRRRSKVRVPQSSLGDPHCSVPALPVEAVKDIELSHGTGRIGRQPRPRHTMSTRQPRSLSASRCPPGYPRRAKRATSPATMQCFRNRCRAKVPANQKIHGPGRNRTSARSFEGCRSIR